MRNCLRGKPRAAAAFLLIAGLVLGGLGWVTAAVLRLETEQHEAAARAEHEERVRTAQRAREQALTTLRREREQEHDQDVADFTAKLRLALWRLDGRIAPVLAREETRPYNHYHAVFAPPVALDHQGNLYEPATVLEPSPLLSADLPEWMVLHFQTAPETGWRSPQVLSLAYKKHLAQNAVALTNETAERRDLLYEMSRSNTFAALQGQLERQELTLAAAVEQEGPVNFEQGQQVAWGRGNYRDGPAGGGALGGAFGGINNGLGGGNYTAGQNGMQQALNPNDPERRGRDPGYGFNSRLGVQQKTSQDVRQGAYDDHAWSATQGLLNKGLPWAVQQKAAPTVRDQVLVRMGPMTPVWLTGGDGKDRLVVARRVSVSSRWVEMLTALSLWPRAGQPAHLVLLAAAQCDKALKQHPREVCQGILLDWPHLQNLLADEVRDLFPNAIVTPVREVVPPRPDRTMTALPVELDPGFAMHEPPAPGPEDLPEALRDEPVAPAPPELGWTPLRVGLGMSWAAALVALGAVGLGGWKLIDLSERRIRFVSAVTHELRTPMTTLRLYLDMLTGGLVTDEARREEYLHTLNAEADRLNRLVSNVLDFSRLEKQHPKLVKSEVTVADLLEQVRATWDQRCRDAEKALEVDDATSGATATTDVQLVQQILGNLIDNACKYSRGAENPRVWLRARVEGQRLLLEVEDRGPGVPRGERRSIFRAFTRGQQADVTAGGVGLGLALAERWAGLLGGKLTLCGDGQPAGACFRLELPLG